MHSTGMGRQKQSGLWVVGLCRTAGLSPRVNMRRLQWFASSGRLGVE